MRTLRTTIVILLFLSLLALSLVGALTLYATPERVTARAAAMLESHLGLRAELSGDVELKRLPKLILRIPAGELIHTKDSTHAGRFASAEIELAPWSLFAQSPRVDRVAVDRLELNDISYVKLLENTTSSAEHTVWNIDQLELTQASIRFDALPHVGAGMLSALDAEFSNLSETGGTVRLAGTLTLPQAPSISAALVSEGSAQTLNGLTGTLTFTGVFTFDAQKGLVLQMPAATFDGISGSMNFKASASASRLTSAPMGQPWIAEKPALGGSLRESTTFSIQAPTASITSDGVFAEYASARGQLSAAKRNWSLAGTAGVDLSWANGSLKLSALDLSSSTDSTTVNRLTGTLNLSADTLQTDLEGTFFGTTVSLHLAQLSGNAVSGNIALGAASAATLESLSPLWGHFVAADGRDFKIAFTIGTLKLSETGKLTALNDVSADLTRSAGIVNLTRGQAAFLNGAVQLAGTLTPDGIWRINSTLKGADAQNAFAVPAPIAGRMDGTFDLEGTFYPLEGTITVAEAKGKVRLTEGTLLGIDLEKARQILINEAPETLPPELVAKTARTRLSELTADIALTKTSESEHFIKISGKALAPRVGSAELPWIAEFAGEASHSQTTIDIKATLAAEGKTPELMLPVQVIFKTGSAPQWIINWFAAAQPAAAAHADEPFTLKKLGQKFERAMKDFWNGIEFPEIDMPKLPSLPKMPWDSDESAAPRQPTDADRSSKQSI